MDRNYTCSDLGIMMATLLLITFPMKTACIISTEFPVMCVCTLSFQNTKNYNSQSLFYTVTHYNSKDCTALTCPTNLIHNDKRPQIVQKSVSHLQILGARGWHKASSILRTHSYGMTSDPHCCLAPISLLHVKWYTLVFLLLLLF
jgi:hypothetical protein